MKEMMIGIITADKAKNTTIINSIRIQMIQCVLLLFAEKGVKMKNITINDKNERQPLKVTVHIPENVSPDVRQRKINRLYDLLKPPENDTDEDKAG